VGTVSIEKSEELSHLLQREGIAHEVLNAKQHERESGIIAQAGRPGAVTIATNMAGRGVDILLGGSAAGLAESQIRRKFKDPEEATPEQMEAIEREMRELCQRDHDHVVEIGGLHIVGTERHEARRIDNQLRGRSGRQGDPGSTRFYLSLEDDLMRRFGGETISKLMTRLGLEEDVPLEHGLVSKSIENAQQKVETYNFDLRKHVVEYDDVMNKQREVIYADRRAVIGEDTLKEMLLTWFEGEIEDLVQSYLSGSPEDWDLEALLVEFQRMVPEPVPTVEYLEQAGSQSGITECLTDCVAQAYELKEQEFGSEMMRQVERSWVLKIIDDRWVRYLTALDDLRNGISLRAYGQRDPLVEYKVEAASMFDELLRSIQSDVSHSIFHLQLNRPPQRPPAPRRMTTNQPAESGGAPAKAGRKIGRNDPCYCGSGKKYKYCCGR